MNITITVTKEQEDVIVKFASLDKFEKELLGYANGLVNFYVSEGQKILDKENMDIDVVRLQVLKEDSKTLATVDAAIAAKVEEPVKDIDKEVVKEEVQ